MQSFPPPQVSGTSSSSTSNSLARSSVGRQMQIQVLPSAFLGTLPSVAFAVIALLDVDAALEV
jgi:hypothetical protein